MNVFDQIGRDARSQLSDLADETASRLRAIEPHGEIKAALGYHGNLREIVSTTIRGREGMGYYHADDLLDAATEAGEAAAMVRGGKNEIIDAIDREFSKREFRILPGECPCDEWNFHDVLAARELDDWFQRKHAA